MIGGSGGDSITACENTAAATTAGLAAGMNAVELDISVSRDQVVFLWNDPNPLDPEAIGRSQEIQDLYFFIETTVQFNFLKGLFRFLNFFGMEQ